jgi:hypothetical protein
VCVGAGLDVRERSSSGPRGGLSLRQPLGEATSPGTTTSRGRTLAPSTPGLPISLPGGYDETSYAAAPSGATIWGVVDTTINQAGAHCTCAGFTRFVVRQARIPTEERGGEYAPPLLQSRGDIKRPEGPSARRWTPSEGEPSSAPRPPSTPRAKCSEQPLWPFESPGGSPFRWALGPPELPQPHSQLAVPTVPARCAQLALRLSQGAPLGPPVRHSGCSERGEDYRPGGGGVNSPKCLLIQRLRRSQRI